MVIRADNLEEDLQRIEEELRNLVLLVSTVRARVEAQQPGRPSQSQAQRPRVGDEVYVTVSQRRHLDPRVVRGQVIGETAQRLKIRIPGSFGGRTVYRAPHNVTLAEPQLIAVPVQDDRGDA